MVDFPRRALDITCGAVFVTDGAGGPEPTLGCNVQAQQNIGSAILFLKLSSSYTATWSCLRTSARKQSSESVGEIVSEETCSFGVRSGFSNFYPNFFQSHFPHFSKEFGKIGSGKKFGKKWFSPLTGYIRLVLECITSVSSYQQNGVFPHCLPPMQH